VACKKGPGGNFPYDGGMAAYDGRENPLARLLPPPPGHPERIALLYTCRRARRPCKKTYTRIDRAASPAHTYARIRKHDPRPLARSRGRKTIEHGCRYDERGLACESYAAPGWDVRPARSLRISSPSPVTPLSNPLSAVISRR
jgi:hypothetical protein